MSVLLFFIDGLGLGPDAPETNPVARARLARLHLVAGRAPTDPSAHLASTDACLGLPGLPQSATGQTTILSGINAAAAVGRHMSGFCRPPLAALLDGASLFSRVRAAGGRTTFANAYTPEYLKHPPRFLSVTTVAVGQAGLPYRTLEDLARGDAVYHDLTGRMLRERGHDVPLLAPEEAGRRLARLAEAHDFSMYEYFLTDMAGHARDMAWATELLEGLESALEALLGALDLSQHLVVLASDHGNAEDLSHDAHTRNPVPTCCWGRGAAEVTRAVRGLEDIAPAILRQVDMVC